MTTNTRTQLDEPANDHGTRTDSARNRAVAVAGFLATLLPTIGVLGALALSVLVPEFAFVLFGVPVAATVGVALAFGVARVGAELANRV